jgi:hypothetical protein
MEKRWAMNYAKASLVWLGFLTVAITGGIIREKFLIPWLGPLGGRALDTLLVSAIILGLIYAYIGRLTGATQGALFRLGIFWTVLTILFECLFGHYVLGASWESIGAEYNILRGRLWPLVLIVTLFGPLFAAKVRDYFRVRKPS